jgi:polysaccharide export outer membrane protein
LVPLALVAGSSLQAQAPARDTGRLSLSPGDVIRIEVWRNKELSGDFPIAADGSITHPLYRELKIAGVPLVTVEEQLRSFLARFETNPSFVIFPLLRVIVAGEVRQPNIYTVPPGTSVAQVIAMAGGPTDRGRLDRVSVVRVSGSQRLDLTRPEVGPSSAEVHSGDQIIVGRRRSFMQDVVGPSSSILAALAAITGVLIQVTRKH